MGHQVTLVSSSVSNPFNVALPTPPHEAGTTEGRLAYRRPSRSRAGGTFHLASPPWEAAGAARSPLLLEASVRPPLAEWPGFGELSGPVWVPPAAPHGYLDLSAASRGATQPSAESGVCGQGSGDFLLSYLLSLGGLGFKGSPWALIRSQKGLVPRGMPRSPLQSQVLPTFQGDRSQA